MTKRARERSAYDFYLIEHGTACAGGVAENLILKQSKRILLTEGDCGLVVKARFIDGGKLSDVAEYI